MTFYPTVTASWAQEQRARVVVDDKGREWVEELDYVGEPIQRQRKASPGESIDFSNSRQWKCVKSNGLIVVRDANGNDVRQFPLRHEVQLLSKDSNAVTRRLAPGEPFDRAAVPWRTLQRRGDVFRSGNGFWIFQNSKGVLGNEEAQFHTELQFYSNNGEMAWRRDGINSPNGTAIVSSQLSQPNWVSEDGSRALLIDGNEFAEDAANGESKMWASAVDARGNELYRVGPYIQISHWALTKSGRFARMNVPYFDNNGRIRRGQIVISVDAKKSHLHSGSGWISISDSGEVHVQQGGKREKLTPSPL